MARTGTKPAGQSALDRTLPLLKPELRPERLDGPQGYLDLIGGEVASTGPVQDLMQLGLLSHVYERWWRPLAGRVVKGPLGPSMTEEYRLAEALLELTPGTTVLDVACGPGNFARRFARAVGETGLVVGIDVSRPMLDRGVQELHETGTGNLALVRADAVELPFVDGAFDAVCCFGALNLFAEPMAALDHMRGVLNPGGRIALLTSCRGRRAPRRALESFLGSLSRMHMFERDEIVDALRKRGFTGIDQRVSGFTQLVGGRLAA